MSPRTRGNVAFGIGALSAIYAIMAAIGLLLCVVTISMGGTIRGVWEAPAIWLVIGIAVAVPSFRYRRSMRWIEAGNCRRCGYDLRATPNQCPECGTTAPEKV